MGPSWEREIGSRYHHKNLQPTESLSKKYRLYRSEMQQLLEFEGARMSALNLYPTIDNNTDFPKWVVCYI